MQVELREDLVLASLKFLLKSLRKQSAENSTSLLAIRLTQIMFRMQLENWRLSHAPNLELKRTLWSHDTMAKIWNVLYTKVNLQNFARNHKVSQEQSERRWFFSFASDVLFWWANTKARYTGKDAQFNLAWNPISLEMDVSNLQLLHAILSNHPNTSLLVLTLLTTGHSPHINAHKISTQIATVTEILSNVIDVFLKPTADSLLLGSNEAMENLLQWIIAVLKLLTYQCGRLTGLPELSDFKSRLSGLWSQAWMLLLEDLHPSFISSRKDQMAEFCVGFANCCLHSGVLRPEFLSDTLRNTLWWQDVLVADLCETSSSLPFTWFLFWILMSRSISLPDSKNKRFDTSMPMRGSSRDLSNDQYLSTHDQPRVMVLAWMLKWIDRAMNSQSIQIPVHVLIKAPIEVIQSGTSGLVLEFFDPFGFVDEAIFEHFLPKLPRSRKWEILLAMQPSCKYSKPWCSLKWWRYVEMKPEYEFPHGMILDSCFPDCQPCDSNMIAQQARHIYDKLDQSPSDMELYLLEQYVDLYQPTGISSDHPLFLFLLKNDFENPEKIQEEPSPSLYGKRKRLSQSDSDSSGSEGDPFADEFTDTRVTKRVNLSETGDLHKSENLKPQLRGDDRVFHAVAAIVVKLLVRQQQVNLISKLMELFHRKREWNHLCFVMVEAIKVGNSMEERGELLMMILNRIHKTMPDAPFKFKFLQLPGILEMHSNSMVLMSPTCKYMKSLLESYSDLFMAEDPHPPYYILNKQKSSIRNIQDDIQLQSGIRRSLLSVLINLFPLWPIANQNPAQNMSFVVLRNATVHDHEIELRSLGACIVPGVILKIESPDETIKDFENIIFAKFVTQFGKSSFTEAVPPELPNFLDMIQLKYQKAPMSDRFSRFWSAKELDSNWECMYHFGCASKKLLPRVLLYTCLAAKKRGKWIISRFAAVHGYASSASMFFAHIDYLVYGWMCFHRVDDDWQFPHEFFSDAIPRDAMVPLVAGPQFAAMLNERTIENPSNSKLTPELMQVFASHLCSYHSVLHFVPSIRGDPDFKSGGSNFSCDPADSSCNEFNARDFYFPVKVFCKVLDIQMACDLPISILKNWATSYRFGIYISKFHLVDIMLYFMSKFETCCENERVPLLHQFGFVLKHFFSLLFQIDRCIVMIVHLLLRLLRLYRHDAIILELLELLLLQTDSDQATKCVPSIHIIVFTLIDLGNKNFAPLVRKLKGREYSLAVRTPLFDYCMGDDRNALDLLSNFHIKEFWRSSYSESVDLSVTDMLQLQPTVYAPLWISVLGSISRYSVSDILANRSIKTHIWTLVGLLKESFPEGLRAAAGVCLAKIGPVGQNVMDSGLDQAEPLLKAKVILERCVHKATHSENPVIASCSMEIAKSDEEILKMIYPNDPHSIEYLCIRNDDLNMSPFSMPPMYISTPYIMFSIAKRLHDLFELLLSVGKRVEDLEGTEHSFNLEEFKLEFDPHSKPPINVMCIVVYMDTDNVSFKEWLCAVTHLLCRSSEDLFWSFSTLCLVDHVFASTIFPLLISAADPSVYRASFDQVFQTMKSETRNPIAAKWFLNTLNISKKRCFLDHSHARQNSFFPVYSTLLTLADVALEVGMYSSALMYLDVSYTEEEKKETTWADSTNSILKSPMHLSSHEKIVGMLLQAYGNLGADFSVRGLSIVHQSLPELARTYQASMKWDEAMLALDSYITNVDSVKPQLDIAAVLHNKGADHLAWVYANWASGKRDSKISMDDHLKFQNLKFQSVWRSIGRFPNHQNDKYIETIMESCTKTRETTCTTMANEVLVQGLVFLYHQELFRLDFVRSGFQVVLESLNHLGSEEYRSLFSHLLHANQILQLQQIASELQVDESVEQQNKHLLDRKLPFDCAESMMRFNYAIINSARLSNSFSKSTAIQFASSLARRYHKPELSRIWISDNQSERGSYEPGIAFEIAKVHWANKEAGTAVAMMQQIISNSSSPRETIKALRLCGHWLSIHAVEEPEEIRNNFLQKAIDNCIVLDDPKLLAKCHLTMAQYTDRLYQNLNEKSKSLAWNRINEIRHARKKNLEELRRDTKHSKNGKRIISKLGKQVDHDQSNLDSEMKLYQSYLIATIESYSSAMSHFDSVMNFSYMFRVVSLWFENATASFIHPVISKSFEILPSHSFLTLVYQIASRLGSELEAPDSAGLQFHFYSSASSEDFKSQVAQVMYRLCDEHPFHTFPHLFALSTGNQESSANEASDKRRIEQSRHIIDMVFKKSKYARHLQKFNEFLNALTAFSTFVAEKSLDKSCTYGHVAKCPEMKAFHEESDKKINIPVLLSTVPIIKDGTSYVTSSGIQWYSHLQDDYNFAGSGLSRPGLVNMVSKSGQNFRMVVKGPSRAQNSDDLRQDAVIQQLFSLVHLLLQQDPICQQNRLGIRTYKVVPLSSQAGVMEFVQNTTALSDCWTRSPHIKRMGHWNLDCHQKLYKAQRTPLSNKVKLLNEILEKYPPTFRGYFLHHYPEPMAWLLSRLAYTKSAAVSSIVGYIAGVGDRHGQNILMDKVTAEVVHIDFGITFGQGALLAVPELVPFRLTPNMIDAMGITGVEGGFRSCCTDTLNVMRKNANAILTVCQVVVFDPLYSWSLASALANKHDEDDDFKPIVPTKYSAKGEAEYVLLQIQQKLQGREDSSMAAIGVDAQVTKLIYEATNVKNLAAIFAGWAPYL